MRLTYAVLIGASLLLGACSNEKTGTYQGWVDADAIFVSPDENGRVTKTYIREGDQIAAGAPLADLDDVLQQADLKQAQATLDNARQTFDRTQQLLRTGSATQSNFDQAQSALRIAEAQVNTARTRLQRRNLKSPVAGAIQQIYFREGEMATATRPVVSILPPGQYKIRFFVPETELPKMALGQSVAVTCDGCATGLTAKIYFIADSAEYTPPVIYSLDERSKLVFLVQARPDQPDKLRVGQPVTIAPAQAGK